MNLAIDLKEKQAPHRKVAQSSRDDWRTPPESMRPILKRFRFTGDACADAVNTWARRFYTSEDNALVKPWDALGRRVWMNPPYSKANAFMRRARLQAFEHGLTVCALVPSTMDVRWWHEDVLPHASEVWLYRGRISFVDPVTVKPTTGNPVGSVLVVWRGGERAGELQVGGLCSVTGRTYNRTGGNRWRE